MKGYQITIGVVSRLNKSETIRANFSVGMGYTTIKEPGNWQKRDRILFGENYTWDYLENNRLSLILNPKIEFLRYRFFGLTISPMLQANKDTFYLGVGIGAMIGLLRKEMINHNN